MTVATMALAATMTPTTATATAHRTVIGLGIGTTLVHRGTTGSGLHQAKDQGLHLQLTAHATAKADFHLALNTHPIHFRRFATGVAGQLLPAVLKHPLDLSLVQSDILRASAVVTTPRRFTRGGATMAPSVLMAARIVTTPSSASC